MVSPWESKNHRMREGVSAKVGHEYHAWKTDRTVDLVC